MRWLLAVVGGVVGFILIRRARKGYQDWGIIILAGLVGALLVMRGLTILLPALQGISGTLHRPRAGGREYRVPGRNLRQAQSGCASAAQPVQPAAESSPTAKDDGTAPPTATK